MIARFGIIGIVALTFLARGASGAPEFTTEVLPWLTRAGCNSGGCHGAATGQGGFRLSLLGYDPDGDFDRLTRELSGRRIDRAEPGRSLILRKPSGELDHEGGKKLPKNSAGYAVVKQWIESGAPRGSRDLGVDSIEVSPEEWNGTEGSVALRVNARFSNGSSRDVTALALYDSNDGTIAEVSKAGEIRVRGKGLTSVMVRFGGRVAAARIAIPIGENPVSVSWNPAGNIIDEHTAREWERFRIEPSDPATDMEFLRRVHLDVTGRLPSSAEVRQFLAESPSADKRNHVIQRLLQSEAFTDYWTLFMGDLLLVNGKEGAVKTYHGWLHHQVADDAPLDKTVRSLLTATGRTEESGPANFMQLAADPRDFSEHVGRMFLGIQIGCARCHTHPTDRWTRSDYHSFAAFFARIGRDNGSITVLDRGEVDDPVTGEPVSPRPLGGMATSTDAAHEKDRRVALANWLTSPGNPWFAKAFVNRVWARLMGRGLVEPVDDLRPTNPPTHPELLEALAADFVRHDFRIRHLVETMVRSQTYQRSSRVTGNNAKDDRLYARALSKPLSAAVFTDAVADVTGVPSEFEGTAAGTRAVQLVSPAIKDHALDLLGRCQRRNTCDGPGTAGGGLAQALHLLNGSTINSRLQKAVPSDWLSLPAKQIVEEVYLRALGRFPDAREQEVFEERFARASGDSVAAAETIQDLLWVVLNSREFAFNH